MPSSAISSFNYDEGEHTLYITFITGLRYKYIHVPPEIYHLLKVAGSKGRYFNHHIRNKFRYKKVSSS